MQDEIQTLKSLFESNNIPVSVEWLQECSDWCKSELLNGNYTLDELKYAIHEQWLALDLQDIETAVLPHDLTHKKFIVLKDNYSLQIMQIVDISKSKYSQLQQIRKQNLLSTLPKTETNDTTETGKRVLQLILTDGVQHIEAVEYKPISVLNINIKPGTKVRLLGPITIRRGCIMLSEENIRILGGEAENLLISNAAENVLAKALKLPENPNPQMIDVNMLNVGEPEINRIQQRQPPALQINFPVHTNQMDDNITDEDLEMLMAVENRLAEENVDRNNELKRPHSDNEENISNVPKIKRTEPTDEEMELLMEMDNEYENNTPVNNRMKDNKTPDLFDDFDPEQIDRLVEMAENKLSQEETANGEVVQVERTAVTKESKINISKQNHSPPSKSKEHNLKQSLFDEFINEDDLFSNLDLDNIETNHSNKKPDIITIRQLTQNIEERKTGTFKIHAKFKAVAEKLTIVKDEFRLVIVVEDEDSEISCLVHNEVVSKWAGATPLEIIAFRAGISSKDLGAMKKLEETLQNVKDELLKLNHDMEISVEDSKALIRNVLLA